MSASAAAAAAEVLGASVSPLAAELRAMEARQAELIQTRDALLSSVRVAMSCLPPPGPLPRDGRASRAPTSAVASSSSATGGSAASAEGGPPTAGGASSASSALGAPAASEAALLGSSATSAAISAAASTSASTTAPAPAPAPAGGGAAGSSSEASLSVSASTVVVAEEEGGRGGDEAEEEEGPLGAVRRIAAELCSSARQAAHANARLGHAMATEREAHKAALAMAQRRVSYLSADVNARLLFAAQPSSHALRSSAGVAFAALMLPTLRGGLPSHWLSAESVESLRRWCEEEGMSLQSLRHVIGRVVHVEGPLDVPTASEGDRSSPNITHGSPRNPYNLPAGAQYFVVHAEMMLQHRWPASGLVSGLASSQ